MRRNRGRGAQPRSRGLTRRRQACWRSRMRVCAVFMSAKLKAWETNGKHLEKFGRNSLSRLFIDN
ncbi:hypothetical protein BWR15_03720 [Pseudomonas sp. T]|nr:hypothetical protein BWR15_03720 [Pseudomonas sp. T]